MAEQRGAIYSTRDGVGIRWREDGRRAYRSGFRNKTEARRWFAENVAPRLRRGAPSSDLTFDAFAICSSSDTVRPSRRRRGRPSRNDSPRAAKRFGSWKLRELEGAAGDVAEWRADLPASSRYRLTGAMRQALAAAVRWDYIGRNPATEAGKNPQPRSRGTSAVRARTDRRARRGTRNAYGPIAGRRRGDRAATGGMDRARATRRRPLGAGLTVQRKYANGVLTPYPKTHRSRRRVPLTARAVAALEALRRGSTRRSFSRPLRVDTSASTLGEPASGIRRSRPRGSSNAVRTVSGIRSRRRRSRPACRYSSSLGSWGRPSR